MSTSKPTDVQQGKPTKKAYQTPQLLVYGTIHEVTQATNSGGSQDGATTSNMMSAGI